MHYLTVSRVLKLVSNELDPYIQRKLAPYLGGLEWINILQQLDAARGKNIESWEYKASDLSIQLRMLTERLGSLGYPFDIQDRNRTCSSYGSVLRLIRNRWAHNDEFQAFDALQVIEISHALLTHIGSSQVATEISDIRADLLESLGAPTKKSTANSPATQPTIPTDAPVRPKPLVNGGSSDMPAGKKPGLQPHPSINYVNDCEEWSQVIVGEQSDLDSMRSTRTRELVRSLIEDIVNVEGPVSPARVARLVGHSFGFSRLSKARVAQISRQYQNTQIKQDEHGFLWPQSMDPGTWTTFRTLGHRDFLEICPYELTNALNYFCDSTNSQHTSDETRKELLDLYGRKRETAEVRKHLNLVISNFQTK